MKTTKEMIAVMQAYEEGKTIEVFYNNKWTRIDEPSWDWVSKDYRVKPEPEYVPYETKKEVLEGIKQHSVFISYISGSDTSYSIHTVNSDSVFITTSTLTFKGAFRTFKWADDGTPFGKLKE